MKLFLLLIIAAMASVVPAQTVTEIGHHGDVHPGDVLKFDIKFNGADAQKIKTASLLFMADPSGVPANQAGFVSSFTSDSVGPNSPSNFHVEVTVPKDVRDGDYRLFVNVEAETGKTQYAAGKQFQMPLFPVRNARKFVPPAITVKELQ